MKTAIRPLLVLFACLAACGLSARAEVGFSFSLIGNRTSVFLLRTETRGISAFRDQAILPTGASPVYFDIRTDSLLTEIHLFYRCKETDLLPPAVMDYGTYIRLKKAHQLRELIREETISNFKASVQRRSGEGIAIDVPFRIKSKTFRRIFGGSNIGLRVSGNISINGNLRQQKFDELQSATQRNTSTSFLIDMTQQFSITGKVGEKVEVKVDQDSERLFDFENSIRLTYTGDKDEIIQKIEAGNVALNLGTRLATFSGRNTGLFGLKTEAKIGALDLTGIASLERGQKNRQSPNQDVQRLELTEKDYLQSQYFWLTDEVTLNDTLDLPSYRDNYRRYTNRQHVAVPQAQQIVQIEVYAGRGTTGGAVEENLIPARATDLQYFHLFDDEDAWDALPSADAVEGDWERLFEPAEYEYDQQLGYIRLKQPLEAGRPLACAFRLTNGNQVGTLPEVGQPADTVAEGEELRLLLLRSDRSEPPDATWNLMFRHVYDLRASNLNPEDFRLDIIRETSASLTDELGPPIDNDTRSYLEVFDFDRNGPNGTGGPDGLIDDLSGSLIDFARGELHFLDLTPFAPSGYYDNDIFVGSEELWIWDTTLVDQGGFIDSAMYTLNPDVLRNEPSRWTLRTEYKGSASVFDLGPLVLEGSEEVTLNGRPLTRGVDYTIDYLSGRLQIINPDAKAPGANLDITYESGQIFQLDKKTLLGLRAEYALWGEGAEESYIGGMFLHLNEKTLDRRVRIGNEPIRNTLYDLNTKLNFKPSFLTRMVDRLPLVETEAPSLFSVDAEIAQVHPNPNSLSNASTGDFNGLAYLDDFEGSRRSTPLGLLRRQWSIASVPEDPEIESHRGRFQWWNPLPDQQVKVKDVYPERQTNERVADRLQSIIFEFRPDSLYGSPSTSWGGVMRYLGDGFADQSRSQFLEFWIKVPSRPSGKLVVDLGTISEDALPNDTLDTEDRPRPGEPLPGQPGYDPRRENGNGALSADEDTGIDGIRGNDDAGGIPQDSAIWNGPNMPKIPSYDDYSYNVGSSNFDGINGTENSRNDEGGNYPDSEDLNNNNFLDLDNDYFSYTIELDRESPFIVGGMNVEIDKGWRLFRIPLEPEQEQSDVRRAVGNPSMTDVRWARIYMTDVTETTKIELVQMDIVANEWLPEFVDLDSTQYVTVAVINNHENPAYTSPPGVQGELDPITDLRQREQSLVLQIRELGGGQAPDEFWISKNLYQDVNLIEYKRLKMFIHGGGIDENLFPQKAFDLVLRMGQSYADIDNNYYEIVQTIKPGWHIDNEIDIATNDLSLMHAVRSEAVAQHNAQFDTAGADSGVVFDLWDETIRWAVNHDSTQPTDSLVIKGNPSLQRVRFLALGVRLHGGVTPPLRDHEIWVDELRVSDIYKDIGTAAEVSTSLNFADLATLSGSYLTRDADFHNVNERVGRGDNTNTIRWNLNFGLDKFHLERWGFDLPMSVQFSETRGVPKFIPNTDARVDLDNVPDSVRSYTRNVTYRASYSKGGNSPNPLVRWSMERLSLDWDHSTEKRRDFRTGKSTRENTGAGLSYGFPTAVGRGLAPLFWAQGIPGMGRLLGNPRFRFKPRSLQLTLTADQVKDHRRSQGGQTTNLQTFTMGQNMSTGFDPFDPLSLDFSRNHTTIHRTDSVRQKGWSDLFKGDFGRLTNVSQSSSARYSPAFTSWLRPNFSYTSGYAWSHTNLEQVNGQTISNNRSIGTDFTLDFRSILGSGAPKRDGARGSTRGRERGETETEKGSEADTTEAVEKVPAGPSMLERLGGSLGYLRKGLTTIDPISLRYDNSNRHSESGTVGQADLAYQLGLTQTPNLEHAEGYSSLPQRTTTETYSARSGLKITRNISTSFNWDLRETETRQQNTSRSRDQTTFWLGGGDEPEHFPMVDVTATWTGLEQVAFLRNLANSVSISSGMSNRMTESWNEIQRSDSAGGSDLQLQSRGFTRSLSPLLGLDISWRGNIDSQIRINRTSSFDRDHISDIKRRSTGTQATVTLSYTISTGFRLPLLWMSAIRLQNQTTFTMNVDYSTDTRESTSALTDSFSKDGGTTQWSLQPRMTYSFSNTVQGQAYVQLQQTKDELTDNKTRLFEFGIQVNIAIRG